MIFLIIMAKNRFNGKNAYFLKKSYFFDFFYEFVDNSSNPLIIRRIRRKSIDLCWKSSSGAIKSALQTPFLGGVQLGGWFMSDSKKARPRAVEKHGFSRFPGGTLGKHEFFDEKPVFWPNRAAKS
jgi:hypothetical protein